MIALDLPAPYASRPLRLDDATRVLDLVSAYQQRVLGEVLIEREDIDADWQRPSTALGDLGCGVFDGQEMVGCGLVSADETCDGFVRPDHWGRGIGSAIARWSWQVARAHEHETVGQTVPDADAGARALFGALGYQRRYSSWMLALLPGAPISDRPLPEGYVLRDFVRDQDEQVAYRVIEDAFNEWEGRVPQSYADWGATVLGRRGFEPGSLRLVQDASGAVVAACVLHLSDDIGWVHQLAVVASARGRGLAQALLADAFTRSRRRGRLRIELSTDSRTGALGLYQKAGMQVTSSLTRWTKQL